MKVQKEKVDPIGVVFGIFTSDEIKKLSVVKVSTPLTFTALGHTLPGGIYDPALGPSQHGVNCTTCSNNIFKCAGHMGHIELPLPVVNPLFHRAVTNFLTYSCLSCHHVLLPEPYKLLLVTQLQLLDKGQLVEALEIENVYSRISLNCEGMSEEDMAIVVAAELNNKTETMLNEIKPHEEWKQTEIIRAKFINNIKQYIHKGKNCPKCKEPWKKLKTLKNQVMVEAKVEVANKFKENKTSNKNAPSIAQLREGNYMYILPSDSMSHLRKIWEHEGTLMKEISPILKSMPGPHPTDVFFMDVVPVTPINTRPVNFIDGAVNEHPQNLVYKSILQDCVVIRSIIQLMNNKSSETPKEDESLSNERIKLIDQLKGKDLSEKLMFTWQEMQKHCDILLDKYMGASGTAASEIQGLKQLIEKKEGILRMHMMGKRVNFAARSVITPDPNLNIDEIGIPDLFAKKLTYPVPVTAWNVTELRKMVINGPDVHPGAVFVENEDGFLSRISADNALIRESIAKTLLTPDEGKGIKIIHRHLLNGDILLLNRQPTLHRPSIMAHKARILKGEKTLRLHYANCKAYNADFDGDEMNAHFPQNEVARSEAYNLASVCSQYLVPKDGTPLSGLIQDHVISGVRLTMRDSLFSREDYMNLVFQALSFLNGDIKILPPVILKPVMLWSGKQIVSTVILNLIPKGKTPLNLASTAKISCKAWEKGPPRPWLAAGTPFSDPKVMTEGEVIIRKGELLSGVLDKTHYGATPYSLVHCFYELYGGKISSQLLSSFSKLFTAFLQLEGFTLGVEDILVTELADKVRLDHISAVRKIGEEVAAKALDLPENTHQSELKKKLGDAYRKNSKFRGLLDHEYKKRLDSFTNNINKVCLPTGLLSIFPANNLQLMVQSGAKGSTVNTMQISCLLGQIELEGKRPPLMVSGRSLPSFPPYDLAPRAGGFIDGRFMTGIQPQEFFFHCMAGREGLIDTAVKTSRSGYLQRCLVKHLEGLTVHYDLTVRDSDGSIVQFRYGEDGMEVMKSQFLKKELIPFLADNVSNILDKSIVEQLRSQSDQHYFSKHLKVMKTWKKQKLNLNEPLRLSGFGLFSVDMNKSQPEKYKRKIKKTCGRSKASIKICKAWKEMDDESKKRYEKKAIKCPDPLVSILQPDVHFSSITEKLEGLVNDYINANNLSDRREQELRDMISLKSSLSVCPAGEPVGMLAAQSVGEPSTQMTLNTFHFAGRGEMNVTLGIPRLREILMAASKNIKTPSMEVPFHQTLKRLEKKAEKLRKSMTRLTLTDVLEYIKVNEHLDYESVFRNYTYVIHFQFLPRSAYKHDTDIRPKDVLRHVERMFINEVVASVFRRSRIKKEVVTSEVEKESSRSKFRKEDDGEDQEIDEREPTSASKAAEDSSDDESIADDEDATAEKRRMKQQEEQEYQDPEEGEEREAADDGPEEEEAVDEAQGEGVGEDEHEDRQKEVLQSSDNIHNYRFDKEFELWCEVTLCLPVKLGRIDLSNLLRDVASKSTISQIRGIRRAFTYTANEKLVLKTDGLNMAHIFTHQNLLDINRLYTNDINAVAQTYGIEAAAKVVVREIQDVFKVYGITVDPRHLLLIADYVTFDGTYQPLNRMGMEGNTSPLQQMSFESSLGFLKKAVLKASTDKLMSPSARLIVGKPVRCGTGAFDLIHCLNPARHSKPKA